MGEKERSRENVGRREEGLKHKARQTDLMAREAEARYSFNFQCSKIHLERDS